MELLFSVPKPLMGFLEGLIISLLQNAIWWSLAYVAYSFFVRHSLYPAYRVAVERKLEERLGRSDRRHVDTACQFMKDALASGIDLQRHFTALQRGLQELKREVNVSTSDEFTVNVMREVPRALLEKRSVMGFLTLTPIAVQYRAAVDGFRPDVKRSNSEVKEYQTPVAGGQTAGEDLQLTVGNPKHS